MLRRYQTARLRALLHHAYETVPFYRRRFDQAGFHPDQFLTLEDLQRVPLTRKADIRLATDEEAVANDCDPSRLHHHITGGSTGEPTKLRFTPYEDRLLRMFRLLATMRLGLRLRDRRTQLRTDQPFPSKIEEHFILPSQIVYAFLPPEQMRANLRKFQPDVIRGFPSALAAFAAQITDEDRLQLRPRFLTTDSENLTDLAREQLENAFKAPVFDIYDCYECNVIAYQCTRSDGYHVMEPSVVVEVLSEGRPVQSGESGEGLWANPRSFPAAQRPQSSSQVSCGSCPCQTLAGIAMLMRCGSTALLCAGAALPEFREMGCHAALLNARIRLASEAGCRQIYSWAELDGQSQANMEKAGLEVVGTSTTWRYSPENR
jgi:phenylacetate-coenzyme A ligase PaaK-like adenylate-forming protein